MSKSACHQRPSTYDDWGPERLTANQRRDLMEIAARYQMATHGVAMSVGGTDPLDWEHLARVKQLNRDINARWTSEHLCFSTVNHANLAGLVPLPFTREVVKHVAERVRIVQDYLELPFLLENVTYYMKVSDREMDELAFTCEVLERAEPGSWLLGVQWHPEETAASDAANQALFEHLVAAARH